MLNPAHRAHLPPETSACLGMTKVAIFNRNQLPILNAPGLDDRAHPATAKLLKDLIPFIQRVAGLQNHSGHENLLQLLRSGSRRSRDVKFEDNAPCCGVNDFLRADAVPYTTIYAITKAEPACMRAAHTPSAAGSSSLRSASVMIQIFVQPSWRICAENTGVRWLRSRSFARLSAESTTPQSPRACRARYTRRSSPSAAFNTPGVASSR
jgi:hypothetical protein